MNFFIRVPLETSPEQLSSLTALQQVFADACNALAPLVQQSRCWNRVTLHHLAYKSLREQFPSIGSQMVCNAIYSVSRTGRLVYQHPESPYNITRLGQKKLPLLHFTNSCPVYFDRHTLSVKAGHLSMFTLEGRTRFQFALSPEDEIIFHQNKLQETVLSRTALGSFELSFALSKPSQSRQLSSLKENDIGEVPEYVMIGECA